MQANKLAAAVPHMGTGLMFRLLKMIALWVLKLIPSSAQPERDRKVTFVATSTTRLAEGDVGKGIVRLHNSRIDRKTHGAIGFRRRETVILRNRDEPSNWTLAVVMGAGRSVEGLSKDCIAIDYDQKEALALRGGAETFEISVSPATYASIVRWYWNHQDPGMMLATRLGVLGFGLGIVGILLGLLPLVTG